MAREVGVHVRTSYRWCWWLRNAALSYEMQRQVEGMVEADELYHTAGQKGQAGREAIIGTPSTWTPQEVRAGPGALLLVWAMVSVVPCLAQAGNDLLRKCTDALRTIDNVERRTGDDQAVANAGWCSGYLNGLLYGYHAGILDENRALGLPLPSRLCPPPQGLIIKKCGDYVKKSQELVTLLDMFLTPS
jgi:hypothetical protein